MKFKPYWSVLPLIAVLTAGLGSYFSSNGMPWYDSVVIKPELTPAKWLFPIAWNFIFVTATCSALRLWNHAPRDERFHVLMLLFLMNAFLNVLWSTLFFGLHQIEWAFYEMLLLEATVLGLMGLSWKRSKLAAVLLLPYALWVGFATVLTYQILQLNPL